MPFPCNLEPNLKPSTYNLRPSPGRFQLGAQNSQHLTDFDDEIKRGLRALL